MELNTLNKLIQDTLDLEDSVDSAIKKAENKNDLSPNILIMFKAYKETVELQKKEIEYLLKAIKNKDIDQLNYHLNKIQSFSKFIKEDSLELLNEL